MAQLLNYPKLDLPTAQETLAFRMVDQTLRTDPVCKRAFGQQIYSWRGDALDDAEPSFDMAPWMRLTPSAEASDWNNVDQHRQPMLVTIELAVAGTNSDNLMNLYGVIRAASSRRSSPSKPSSRMPPRRPASPRRV